MKLHLPSPLTLLLICPTLALTLLSAALWIASAMTSTPASVGQVLLSLASLGGWIGAILFAAKTARRGFLLWAAIFWLGGGALYLTVSAALSVKEGLSLLPVLLSVPVWSYSAPISLLGVTEPVAGTVLCALPALGMGIFAAIEARRCRA